MLAKIFSRNLVRGTRVHRSVLHFPTISSATASSAFRRFAPCRAYAPHSDGKKNRRRYRALAHRSRERDLRTGEQAIIENEGGGRVGETSMDATTFILGKRRFSGIQYNFEMIRGRDVTRDNVTLVERIARISMRHALIEPPRRILPNSCTMNIRFS